MGLTQFWHPDTCRNGQCVIEETKDAEPVLVSIVQTCLLHAGLGPNYFTLVLAANRVKNGAIAEAVAELGSLDGGASIPWRVEADGRFFVTTGLNAQRRARLQAAVDARVGTGKVVIE
jgi:hypothetical protein